MLALLSELGDRGQRSPVQVVHADRSRSDHALRDDQSTLAGKLADGRTQYWYEQTPADGPGERAGLADLTDLDLPHGTAAYLCGPLPFMRAMREQLLAKGVAAADIHYEVFGPDLWLATA
jgi:nitric oxide dioxygenase